MAWEPKKSKKSFITNTVTQETVRFQFNPVTLDTIKEGAYDDQDNKNLVPYQGWKGGKQQINFPLQFARTPNFDSAEAVVILRSFADPMKVNGKFKDPATCLVSIGSGSWFVKIRKVHVVYTKWSPDGTSQNFDVMIECSEFLDVPKPPAKVTKAKKAPKAKKPKEPESKPYEYLQKPQRGTPGVNGNPYH